MMLYRIPETAEEVTLRELGVADSDLMVTLDFSVLVDATPGDPGDRTTPPTGPTMDAVGVCDVQVSDAHGVSRQHVAAILDLGNAAMLNWLHDWADRTYGEFWTLALAQSMTEIDEAASDYAAECRMDDRRGR